MIISMTNNDCKHVVVVNPLPPLLLEGVRSSRFSLHVASSASAPAGSVQRSRGVCMWVQLKRLYVCHVDICCRGHSCDGCEVVSTLCRYVLRKGDLSHEGCVVFVVHV